ncbi:MAG: hypothetical protein Ct9H300mP25_00840 [Acidobacteriota bacterium]|nr:MAG: hypothetical protein Ct9H300mP25_00840 [Acidobacteriota bacterium]
MFSRLVFGVALLVVGGSVTGRTQHDIADVVDSAKRGELLTLRNAVAAGQMLRSLLLMGQRHFCGRAIEMILRWPVASHGECAIECGQDLGVTLCGLPVKIETPDGYVVGFRRCRSEFSITER